jgi:release factor glutamine methyltransferase
MTIREALQWARARLQASPTPYEDARLLLQHVLQAGHTTIAAHSERALSAEQEEHFRTLVARAERLEPIPYITGEAAFYGLDFSVTPDVLIPRPETEHLVEAALGWAERHPVERIADVGTGSGCIAVVLAQRLPHADITAIDVSQEALAVARQNVQRHGVAYSFDIMVANLPYISDAEWTAVDDGVKWYEPVGALRGGPDGLDLIRHLLLQARPLLRPSGALFLEIGWRQGSAARKLARETFPLAQITVQTDFAGRDRLLVIVTPNQSDRFREK